MQRNRPFLTALISLTAVVGAITAGLLFLTAEERPVYRVRNNPTLEPTAERAQPVTETVAINPINLRSGNFVESGQPVRGIAQIREENGAVYLELDPVFGIPPQGEVEVLLAPDAVPSSPGLGENYLNLGRLTANQGRQRYLIPAGTDPNIFRSVVLLSPVSDQILGYAPFQPVPIAGEVIQPITEVADNAPVAPVETAQIPPAAAPAIPLEDPLVILPVQVAQVAEPVEAAQAPPPAAPVETAQAEPEAPAPAPVRAPRALW